MSSHVDRRAAFIRAAYTAALLIVVAGAIAASVEMGTTSTVRGAVPTVMDGLYSVPIYIGALAGAG